MLNRSEINIFPGVTVHNREKPHGFPKPPWKLKPGEALILDGWLPSTVLATYGLPEGRNGNGNGASNSRPHDVFALITQAMPLAVRDTAGHIGEQEDRSIIYPDRHASGAYVFLPGLNPIFIPIDPEITAQKFIDAAVSYPTGFPFIDRLRMAAGLEPFTRNSMKSRLYGNGAHR